MMSAGMLLRPLIAVAQGYVAHAVLLLTGPVARGRGTTVAACAYGLGPAVVDAIPLLTCVAPMGTVWSLVSCALQVSSAQQVSGLRAACAVLALPSAVLVAAMVALTLLLLA